MPENRRGGNTMGDDHIDAAAAVEIAEITPGMKDEAVDVLVEAFKT